MSDNTHGQRLGRAVAEQVRSWTGQDGGENFFLALVARTDVDGLRHDLDRHARRASEAFAEFGHWLDADLAPRGRDQDAVGRERYSLGSRYFLGATVDLEETYAWGFEELKRIEDEMGRVAETIVPGGTLDEAATGSGSTCLARCFRGAGEPGSGAGRDASAHPLAGNARMTAYPACDATRLASLNPWRSSRSARPRPGHVAPIPGWPATLLSW